ncbi:MAG: NUDIX domain-containing protein, partial [Chitinophagaceae bacterium]
CKNLINSARYISKHLKVIFPDSYEKINELDGIGPYTAAAISSFAFNLPFAVVDGNVFRVLSRVFGSSLPIDTGKGKNYFSQLANEVLDKNEPGKYNQAIMDFGAVLCKPVTPLCAGCPFNKICFAFLHKKIDELPVKKKKINIRKRWFYYFLIENENKVAVRQRKENDIWQQLYEFPLIETKKDEPLNKMLRQAEKSGWLPVNNYEVFAVSPLYKQQLSHQLIVGKFIVIRLKTKDAPIENSICVTKKGMKKLAFPKFINQYLDEKDKQ